MVAKNQVESSRETTNRWIGVKRVLQIKQESFQAAKPFLRCGAFLFGADWGVVTIVTGS
jgi:hypothetical protein